jgi:hypothetical protein
MGVRRRTIERMFDDRPTDEYTETALRNLAERDERLGALQTKAVELSAVIGAATGQLLEVIAGFDDAYSGGHGSSGNLETRDWVAWACGTDKRSASRLLRLAHRLKELPQTAAGLRAGTVTLDKVDALSRIASSDNEEVLLQWAATATAEQLRTLAAGYLRSVKATEDAFARRAARSVTYHFDDFGDLNLRARLPGEQGAVVTKALEAAVEELRAETEGGSEAGRRPEADAADALIAVADSYLAAGTAARSNTERFQVVISTERNPVTGELFDARLPKDIPLPIESALRLTCDCSVVEMGTLNGEPFDIGRKSRRPSTAMRRALAKRDGCCRFPGCSRKAYLDAHHIKHWTKGGATSLDNLALLCWHHHRLVHEGRYDVKMDGRGVITFLRPDGSAVPERPPTCELSRAEIEAAADLLYATPAEPHWIDPLDLDLAVTVLHQLERPPPEPTCAGSGEP